MRQSRNIRSEFIVALMSLIMLGFALAFAVLLASSSSNSQATGTPLAQDLTSNASVGVPDITRTLIPRPTDDPEVATQRIGTAQAILEQTRRAPVNAPTQTFSVFVSPVATTENASPVASEETSVSEQATTPAPVTEPTTLAPVTEATTIAQVVTTVAPTATRQRATATPTPTPTKTVTLELTEEAIATTDVTVEAEPTTTPTDEATKAVEDATNTPEETENAPDATVTKRATATTEAVQAATLTSTIKPSATDAATATFTATATPTQTFTPTATNTATLTHTPTATHTFTATPTNTPTATQTFTPTPTNTATHTPMPTATYTPSSTPTPTKVPTALPGILPTTTPLNGIAEIVATRTPAVCGKPTGWVEYTVQSGNTLFAIAVAVGSTVPELRDVNCLTNENRLTTGDILFVPRQPNRPVATSVPPGLTPGRVIVPVGCTDPSVRITSPLPFQPLKSVITLQGSANVENFWYYKLEVRPDWATVYNFYSDSKTAVINGSLGSIDTDTFDNGLHWLKLSVVNIGGGIATTATCDIPVIFE